MLITNANIGIPFAPNFIISEFWHGIDFELDDNLIKAAQVFRDWHKKPISIIRTYAPSDGWGYHVQKLAIDLSPTNVNEKVKFHNDYSEEILKYYKGERGGLIEKLRMLGITGFGIESAGNHFDKRPGNTCKITDKYGAFTVFVWDGYIDKTTGKVISTKNYSLAPKDLR